MKTRGAARRPGEAARSADAPARPQSSSAAEPVAQPPVLTAGAEVIVRPLKRRGVVASVLSPGVYRVQVGAMTMTVREGDLDAPPLSKRKKPKGPGVRAEGGPDLTGDTAGRASALASVDLHGLTVDEARNKVAGHISRAILAGLDRVEIIHGIGTGRLKAAITRDLRAIAAVRAVKPHPDNPGISVAYF